MAYIGTSIVDYLNQAGQASDYNSRATLATQNGIQGYSGTAQQNTQLLGILNKPSNVIPTASMAPATPLQLPAPLADTNNYSSITSGITDSILNDYNNLNKQLTDQQNAQNRTGTDITDLMKQLTERTADTQAANESAGVNAESANLNKYTQQLADLNAQASSLNREAQAIPLQTQENNRNTGATDQGVAPATAGALRLNAIRALSIGQQADIASAAMTGSQLRLQSAKDKAEQIIQLKYAPLEAQLAIKEKQYSLNRDVLASIDSRRTEALGLAIDKEKTALADAKAKDKTMNDTLFKAMQGGAPPELTSAIQKTINEGTATVSEVSQMLAEYTINLPASADEYLFAKRNGYMGSFTQYQNEDANRKQKAITPGNSTPSNQNDTTTFTKTQINKGASNAGVSINEFNGYTQDDKNFFINSATTKQKVISDAQKSGEDLNSLISEINSSDLSQVVKDNLIKYAKGLYPESTQSSEFNWWNPLSYGAGIYDATHK